MVETAGKVGCPSCKHPVTLVAVTVSARRYRRCHKCNHRFTTYEVSDTEYFFLRATQDLLNRAERKHWLPGYKGKAAQNAPK